TLCISWFYFFVFILFFFFFQAEDGIRDYKVTGVQTCALPISVPLRRAGVRPAIPTPRGRAVPRRRTGPPRRSSPRPAGPGPPARADPPPGARPPSGPAG